MHLYFRPTYLKTLIRKEIKTLEINDSIKPII